MEFNQRSDRLIIPFEKSGNTLEAEIMALKSFLASERIRLPENFFKIIAAGDIVEVYSLPSSKQIYANQEFNRLSSYTPEQMRTIPNQHLFWRPDETHRRLLERSLEITAQAKEAVPWNLPPHELVESLHPRKRTFEMHFGWASPGWDVENGDLKALASTLKVELIYEWPEAI